MTRSIGTFTENPGSVVPISQEKIHMHSMGPKISVAVRWHHNEPEALTLSEAAPYGPFQAVRVNLA
jgi:hypothetical protein